MFALDPTADEHFHPDNGLCVIRADGTGLTLLLGGADFKREPDWVNGPYAALACAAGRHTCRGR